MSKILVVDDSPDIVEIVASRLEANGYDVITAESGKEALELLKEEKPDLILLDISMPEMDGFETGQRIKADEETKHIPIIMVTAKGEHADVLRAIGEVKAVDYVVKPFKPEKLLEKVQKALSR